MKPTKMDEHWELNYFFALSTPELMKALSCGRSTAVKIGTAAGARMKIGKRILWNTEKIRAYLNSISEQGGMKNE